MTDDRFTHLSDEGRPRMVDVTSKEETSRVAHAEGVIRMLPRTFRSLEEEGSPKGDVLRVGELAGIQAAKRTSELIPLCHLLPAVSVEVTLDGEPSLPGVRAHATATVRGSTGVEMEALTAVSVALLTVYDMLKSGDRGLSIEGIRLLEKRGGRSGHWKAADTDDSK